MNIIKGKFNCKVTSKDYNEYTLGEVQNYENYATLEIFLNDYVMLELFINFDLDKFKELNRINKILDLYNFYLIEKNKIV